MEIKIYLFFKNLKFFMLFIELLFITLVLIKLGFLSSVIILILLFNFGFELSKESQNDFLQLFIS